MQADNIGTVIKEKATSTLKNEKNINVCTKRRKRRKGRRTNGESDGGLVVKIRKKRKEKLRSLRFTHTLSYIAKVISISYMLIRLCIIDILLLCIIVTYMCLAIQANCVTKSSYFRGLLVFLRGLVPLKSAVSVKSTV